MLQYNFHYIPRSKNYTNFNQLKSLRFRLKVILKSFLPLSLSAIRQFQGGIISPLVVAKRSCLITDRKVQAHVSLVYTQNFQNVLSSYPSTTTPPANNAIGGGGGSSLSLCPPIWSMITDDKQFHTVARLHTWQINWYTTECVTRICAGETPRSIRCVHYYAALYLAVRPRRPGIYRLPARSNRLAFYPPAHAGKICSEPVR